MTEVEVEGEAGPASGSRASDRFRADRSRYPRWAWLTERSLWAVAVYRLGQMTLEGRRPIGPLLILAYAALHQVTKVVTAIEIPRSATIGPGLRIWHGGPVIINANAHVGSGCTINAGLILGHDGRTDEAPTIGDRVTFGPGAIVLGPVVVGDDCLIGALSLVTADIPAGSRTSGAPARVREPAASITS